MPYIKAEDREKFITSLNACPDFKSKGELEYMIFSLMKIYMNSHEFRYSDLHDCVYAAQHCADEFRRRFLDVRENTAIVENGDIE